MPLSDTNRFAEAVRTAEKEAQLDKAIADLVLTAREAEREACATVADEFYRKDSRRTPDYYSAAADIADAIRARKASHDS